MSAFEFATAARIVFGRGKLDRAGELAAELGTRAFVVRSSEHLDRSGAMERLLDAVGERGISCTCFLVEGEPELETVEQALTLARAAAADLVIGIGGGSALDTAKAVAGLVTQEGQLLDYLEVIGDGKPLTRAPLPLVAIPTTAGTGSEVTRNAVIASKRHAYKASVRSPHLLPRVALVDPSLTDSLPPTVTASTGLDALTQVIEPFVSLRAQPLTDAIARDAIARAASALERAVRNGGDHAARDDMALVALSGGLALANAGLGAVHGFAAPLGAAFPVPHGVACAALLPHVMRANVTALRSRAPASPVLARYAEVGRLLGARSDLSDAQATDSGLELVQALVSRLAIPGLARFGVREQHLSELVTRARNASSMKGNPVVLQEDELVGCLRAAL